MCRSWMRLIPLWLSRAIGLQCQLNSACNDSLIHQQPEASYWRLTNWPSKVDRAPKSLGKGHLSSEEYHHMVDAFHLIQSKVELIGTGLLNIGVHLHVLWMCVCGV